MDGVELADFGVNGDPFIGNPDADVHVVAFEAPGCSNCKRYHEANYPAVKSDFIDTGLIGYHYLQWNVGYGYDRAGGVALECAHREGGSEAYIWLLDKVFSRQHDTQGLPEMLQQTAAQFALNDAVLQACLENEETLGEVQQDIEKGMESGAGSNPGFAIVKGNEVTIVKGSAGPYDAIQAAL